MAYNYTTNTRSNLTSNLHYIGARYVPAWYEDSNEGGYQWDSDTAYPALIIVKYSVTDSDGIEEPHYYISKKPVPNTVGAPPENTPYWADLGVSSEYLNNRINKVIEDAEKEAETRQAQINEVNSKVDAEIEDREDGDKQLQTNIDGLESTMNEKFTSVESVIDALGDTYMAKANPTGSGSFSLNRKANSVIGENSFVEGGYTYRNTSYFNEASGTSSHAEGGNTTASGNSSHAEGSNTTASGIAAHAEGTNTTASGYSSHTEGDNTTASSNYSHAEGGYTTASESYSHAEGGNTTASMVYSHAEGYHSTASGSKSHAEGNYAKASGNSSHAEGDHSTASGSSSHAEGSNTTASGDSSHAQNEGTAASTRSETALGEYNVVQTTSTVRGAYALELGNGTSVKTRSNALAIEWTGTARLAGDVYTGCETDSSGGKKLATEELANEKVQDITLTNENGVYTLSKNINGTVSEVGTFEIPEDNNAVVEVKDTVVETTEGNYQHDFHTVKETLSDGTEQDVETFRVARKQLTGVDFADNTLTLYWIDQTGNETTQTISLA